MDESLHILFEDNHCLAVVKPAPLATQAPAGIDSLEARVKAYLKDRYHKAGNVYLGIPHRLDRPVSGAMVFARNTKAARRLAQQFQERQVEKVYWGALEGDVQPAEGVWEDWMRKVPDHARAELAEPGSPGAQLASLSYEVLQPCASGTLVAFRPVTGRMHQIRLQAASRGWPVLGDVLYGGRLPFGPSSDAPRERIIALHARRLTFLHPIRYEPVSVIAPLPALWHEMLGTDVSSA